MNSKIGLLGVVAVLQVVLIFVLSMKPGSSTNENETLLTLQSEDVTALLVSDGANEVEVIRTTNGWQVAGVQADADKMTSTLEKLASVAVTWPVASSSASAQRFEVDEDSFQRRLRVMAGENQLAELFLGTSPGYQQVHARRSDSDDIYSVGLSNYELGVNTDDWLDKALLAASGTPNSITLNFLSADEPRQETLLRGEEGWLLNGMPADQNAAGTYANRFTTLRVLGLADDTEAQTMLAEVVVTQGDASTTFSIAKVVDQDEYVISGESGSKYRLATYVAEQLLMTDADFAVKAELTEPAGEELGET